MSDVLKPIGTDEYEIFYRELYSSGDGGLVFPQFRVALDTDPTLNPKGINEKISKVQALKDRLIVILNRAIKNENYWKTVEKKIDARYESEYQSAMVLDSTKKAGNSGLQAAAATEEAKRQLLIKVFKGDGSYDSKVSEIATKHAEAISFYSEVKNLYENLEGTSMGLAVQLKSAMMNARIYGSEGGIEKGGHYGG